MLVMRHTFNVKMQNLNISGYKGVTNQKITCNITLTLGQRRKLNRDKQDYS